MELICDNPAIKAFSGQSKGSKRQYINWEPKATDVDDLKNVVFDIIRAGFRGGSGGKDYRKIFANAKDGIFINKEIWREYSDNHFKNTDKAMRLMQCATNPSMLLKPLLIQEDEDQVILINDDLDLHNQDFVSAIRNYSNNEIPSKFIATKNLLEDKILNNRGPKGKAIIWTIFLDTMDAMKEYLEQNGIRSELLRGATPTEGDTSAVEKGLLTREKIIDLFHEENSEFKVIIANPFAVGESISLHKACHNAIYVEKNYNAAQFIQSKDRIHRVGLKKDDLINYHYILSEGTVDTSIHDRLLIKERRMLDVIEKDEIPLIAENLDADENANDFQAIIRDYVNRQS